MLRVRYVLAIAQSQGLLFIEAPSCSHPMAQSEEDGHCRGSIYSCVNYIVLKGQSFTLMTERRDQKSIQVRENTQSVVLGDT